MGDVTKWVLGIVSLVALTSGIIISINKEKERQRDGDRKKERRRGKRENVFPMLRTEKQNHANPCFLPSC